MERTSNDVNIKKNSKFNSLFFMLIIVLFIGIIYGALLISYESADFLEKLKIIVINYASSRQTQPITTTLINSFISSVLFLLMPYLFGYCAISQPLSFFAVFVKGLTTGTTIGYFYSFYGLKGFGYSAIIIVPVALITSFVLIIASREAIKMSNLIFLSLLNPKNVLLSCNVLKLYNLKNLILLGFMLASSVIDTILVLIFSKLFVFI